MRGRGDERQSGRSYPTREECGLIEQTVQTDQRESTEVSTPYSQWYMGQGGANGHEYLGNAPMWTCYERGEGVADCQVA